MAIEVRGGTSNLAGHRVSRVNGVLTFDTRSPAQVAADKLYAAEIASAREARNQMCKEQRLNRQLLMTKTRRTR